MLRSVRMIEVNNVSMRFRIPKRYREYLFHPLRQPSEIAALSDVSLKIEKGDAVAFLGPNGAGKTTLLKTIGGMLYPTNGNVSVNGHDTVRQNSKAHETVGYVINEDRSFYWRLTGRQNLEFFGVLDNVPPEELKQAIERLLTFVGMSEHADKQVYGYSSGMRQRLAIARGLLSNPEILILDEPTRTLDPLSAASLRTLIYHELHKAQNKTLLVATHMVQEVELLCNKVCVINNGKIIKYMKLTEIKEQFDSIERFYTAVIGEAK